MDGKTIREASRYLGVSDHTVRNWLTRCPWLPRERGIRHWPKTQLGSNRPVNCATADLESIKLRIGDDAREAANVRLKPLRIKNMRSAQRRSVETQSPAPRTGTVSAAGAAAIANVDKSTIHRAYKAGELKPCSKKPSRFSEVAVRKWADGQPPKPGEVAVNELAARLPGPPGPMNCRGESRKLSRIKGAIRRLQIETFLRTAPDKNGRRWELAHVREERIPEIAAAVGVEIQPAAQPQPVVTPAVQTVARQTPPSDEAPVNKGGRPRRWEPHEAWLDEHESQIAAASSPKLLNKTLANECNRAFESLRLANPRKYSRINADQMKELRKSRRKRGKT